jgi:BMFP domain-containing protein YqiC
MLRKVSFGVSYDTNRGADPGVFTATRQQLSAINVRVEFMNNRNPNVSKKEWDKFLLEKAQPFFDKVNQSTRKLINTRENPLVWYDPAMQKWFEETQAALAAAAPGDPVETVFKEQYNKLPIDELSEATVFQLNEFERQFQVFLEARDEVLDEIAKGGIVTFEYTNKREVNAPNTSNFRLIAETGTKGRVDFTFNGSLTTFDKKPEGANVGRIRDFQFATQIDAPFGDVRGIGQFVFSFAGRYERLMEDAQTQVGTTVPGTKGDIAVGQVKLTIPVKGLGMKFPVSFTFANRTELVKEKEVRGNFGFTFDLDTIFARFKPF